MFTELLMNIAHEMLVNTRNSSLYLVNGTELNAAVPFIKAVSDIWPFCVFLLFWHLVRSIYKIHKEFFYYLGKKCLF